MPLALYFIETMAKLVLIGNIISDSNDYSQVMKNAYLRAVRGYLLKLICDI